MSILLSTSLIVTGSGLTIYIVGKRINNMLKNYKYNYHIDNLSEQIKESKNIIKYAILYNCSRYIYQNYFLNYNIINKSLEIIKYPLLLLMINQYYNNFISLLFFNSITTNKKYKYLIGCSFIITGIGFLF
jgi:hypothetical protein